MTISAVSFSGIFSQGFGLIATVYRGTTGTIAVQGPNVAQVGQWYEILGGSQDPVGTNTSGIAHYTGPIPPYDQNYPQSYPDGALITSEDIMIQLEWRDALGGVTTSAETPLLVLAGSSWSTGQVVSPYLLPTNQQPVLGLYFKIVRVVNHVYFITADDGVESTTPTEGASIKVVVTFDVVLKAGYGLVSATLKVGTGGTPTPISVGDQLSGYSGDHVYITIVTQKLKYQINLEVTSSGIGNCDAARNLAALGYTSGGGAINGPGGLSAIVQSMGTATESGEVDAGALASVFASSNDVWTRLVSLVVNGTDYTITPSGTLTDEFSYCGPNGICGGVYFKVDTDINAVATFIADQPCTGGPGVPGHPPGPGGLPGGISHYPPGTDLTDPLNPQWPPHPDYPDEDIGGDNFGPMPPGGYGTSGGGAGGGSGTGGGGNGDTPGGDGSDGAGSGSSGSSGDSGLAIGTVNFPIGMDWSKDAQGLIIRWQDDNKKWSKERYVGLVGRKELAAWIQPHGQFTSRRYELIHVDSLPAVVVYLETEPEVME